MKHPLLSLSFLFLLFVAPVKLQAQELLWDIDFKFGFDNREYNREQPVPSGTHFGANCIPKVGLGFEGNNAIYAGLDFSRYFGKIDPSYSARALLYFQHNGKHLFVNAGAYPSKNRKGDYPFAFQGEYRFFDNVYEGALFRYSRKDWMAEALANWTGLKQEHNRERFLVYAFAQYKNHHFPYIYASASYMMHHYACSKTVRNVVDNVWVYPYIGIDLTPLLPSKMKLDAQLGYLQTFQNDRRTGEGYVRPGGYHFNFKFEYKGFGFKNLLYLGDNLQPFFDRTDGADIPYGTNLYMGSRFFSTTSGIYDRFDLYYTYHINDMLSVSLTSAQHFDGHYVNWQQLIRMTVNLNNFNFKKKGK